MADGKITIEVTLADGSGIQVAADQLFNFLSTSDPSNVPDIASYNSYTFTVSSDPTSES